MLPYWLFVPPLLFDMFLYAERPLCCHEVLNFFATLQTPLSTERHREMYTLRLTATRDATLYILSVHVKWLQLLYVKKPSKQDSQ